MSQPEDSINVITLDLSKRDWMIGQIWPGPNPTIPFGLPTKTDDVSPLPNNSPNLDKVERWDCSGGFPRVFHPLNPNGLAAIVCQGHSSDLHELGCEEVINDLVGAGVTVVGVVMPGGTETSSGSTGTHSNLDLDDFLTPVAIAVNGLVDLGKTSIFMTGISGGGWTTTVYSAIDTRITKSCDVAGSAPTYVPISGRDKEQQLPNVYPSLDYIDLYLLAGYQSRHLLIRHEDDDCCFNLAQYESVESFEDELDLLSTLVGSDVETVWLDQTAHVISEEGKNLILQDWGITPPVNPPPPPPPPPPPTSEDINDDPTFVGTWTPWSGGYDNDLYFHAADQSGDTASWSFSVDPVKTYKVYASWKEHNNRATNAPYTVLDGINELGSHSVNQKVIPGVLGDLWELLGEYAFPSGVALVRLGTDADGYVIADAIKIEEQP